MPSSLVIFMYSHFTNFRLQVFCDLFLLPIPANGLFCAGVLYKIFPNVMSRYSINFGPAGLIEISLHIK